MSKDWIASIAQNIKEKSHAAAEEYGRSQHQAGIVTAEGRPFFAAFATCVEDDINEIRRQLQGDVTASDTTFKANGPSEIKLTRSRFPWFDADITHRDSTVVVDYAKGLGVWGDPALNRRSSNFEFQVDDEDRLFVREAFGDQPKRFREPAELARHVIQLLFEV